MPLQSVMVSWLIGVRARGIVVRVVGVAMVMDSGWKNRNKRKFLLMMRDIR